MANIIQYNQIGETAPPSTRSVTVDKNKKDMETIDLEALQL